MIRPRNDPRATPRRALIRAVLLAAIALVAVFASLRFPADALGQGVMMDRTGTVGIRNEEEKRVFSALLCTCGCPRESIATCPCGFANERRNDVRAMMAQGMNQEDIKAEWVRRFGPQSLEVPPNTGANRLLYLMPIGAIIAMAAIVVTVLRRFRRRGGDDPPTKAGSDNGADTKDEYDQKLDDELKQLDDENDK